VLNDPEVNHRFQGFKWDQERTYAKQTAGSRRDRTLLQNIEGIPFARLPRAKINQSPSDGQTISPEVESLKKAFQCQHFVLPSTPHNAHRFADPCQPEVITALQGDMPARLCQYLWVDDGRTAIRCAPDASGWLHQVKPAEASAQLLSDGEMLGLCHPEGARHNDLAHTTVLPARRRHSPPAVARPNHDDQLGVFCQYIVNNFTELPCSINLLGGERTCWSVRYDTVVSQTLPLHWVGRWQLQKQTSVSLPKSQYEKENNNLKESEYT